MANMITRCPACETSFRITEAQLNTAKGAVRCGSCLQIFRALDNLLPARGAAPVPSSATRTSNSAQPATPKFQYQRPAPRPAPLSPTEAATAASSASAEASGPELASQTRPPSASKEVEQATNDNWQFPASDDEVSSQLSQEGMFKFDQKSIDAAEGDELTDDLLISDEMSLSDEEESNASIFSDDLSESFLDLDSWQPSHKPLFDRDPKTARKRIDENEDENAEEPDESWALSLLEEEESSETTQEEAIATETTAEPDYDPAPATDPFDDFDLVEDEDEDEDEDSETQVEQQYSRAATGSFAVLDSSSGQAQEHEAEERSEAGWSVEDYDSAELDYLARAQDDRHHLLSRIEPEPVEFAVYQGRNWGKTLLWGGLATLGLALLVLQVGWLQFDRLSRQQPFRDIYAAVCPALGCELPSLAAPNLIRTSNLVVRSHPRAEGALMVDTILLNTASFQQPFPDLVLTFSNIHGETLAERRFTPREYLAGELAGRNNMPANQPVHLSLEIVDPGPDAVNYSAYIPD